MTVYVQRITNPNEFDRIELIGPFDDAGAAADWGATYCSPGGPDDPRWNVVDLHDEDSLTAMDDDSTCFLVPVAKPTGVVMEGAYKSGRVRRYG